MNYEVHRRKVGEGGYKRISKKGLTETKFEDKDIVQGPDYQYAIYAFDKGKRSDPKTVFAFYPFAVNLHSADGRKMETPQIPYGQPFIIAVEMRWQGQHFDKPPSIKINGQEKPLEELQAGTIFKFQIDTTDNDLLGKKEGKVKYAIIGFIGAIEYKLEKEFEIVSAHEVKITSIHPDTFHLEQTDRIITIKGYGFNLCAEHTRTNDMYQPHIIGIPIVIFSNLGDQNVRIMPEAIQIINDREVKVKLPPDNRLVTGDYSLLIQHPRQESLKATYDGPFKIRPKPKALRIDKCEPDSNRLATAEHMDVVIHGDYFDIFNEQNPPLFSFLEGNNDYGVKVSQINHIDKTHIKLKLFIPRNVENKILNVKIKDQRFQDIEFELPRGFTILTKVTHFIITTITPDSGKIGKNTLKIQGVGFDILPLNVRPKIQLQRENTRTMDVIVDSYSKTGDTLTLKVQIPNFPIGVCNLILTHPSQTISGQAPFTIIAPDDTITTDPESIELDNSGSLDTSRKELKIMLHGELKDTKVKLSFDTPDLCKFVANALQDELELPFGTDPEVTCTLAAHDLTHIDEKRLKLKIELYRKIAGTDTQIKEKTVEIKIKAAQYTLEAEVEHPQLYVNPAAGSAETRETLVTVRGKELKDKFIALYLQPTNVHYQIKKEDGEIWVLDKNPIRIPKKEFKFTVEVLANNNFEGEKSMNFWIYLIKKEGNNIIRLPDASGKKIEKLISIRVIGNPPPPSATVTPPS